MQNTTVTTQENIYATATAPSNITPTDNNLLAFLQKKFNEEEQQLFVQSFSMYLHYDQEREFVISLDDVWKWIGFGTKGKCKELLEKMFVKDTDYKTSFSPDGKKPQGGRPSEQIHINIKTFKKLCLKASTKKADTIHDYYIKMEEALQEYIVCDLRRQLLENQERLLVESFRKKKVVYFGTFIYTDSSGTKHVIGKFGCTADIYERLKEHKNRIGGEFHLEFVVECEQHEDLERKMKQHPSIKQYRIKKEINGRNMTELVLLDETFTIESMKRIVLELKKRVQENKELLEMKHREIMKKYELEILQVSIKEREMQHEERLLVLKQQHELAMRRLELGMTQEVVTVAAAQPKVVVVLKCSVDGTVLQEFNSYTSAAKDVSGNRNTLSNCCSKGLPYKGFFWKVKN